MNPHAKPICDMRRDDGELRWCDKHAPEKVRADNERDAKCEALRAAIGREAAKLREQLPVGFRAPGSLRQAAAAADRLARFVFDIPHSEDCEGDLDNGNDDKCTQCNLREGLCSCTCGMDQAWRDALIIRPQGVKDPQPER